MVTPDSAKYSRWYDTVASTRLHNDSQQLLVFTRWHMEDLAGRLLEQEGEYDPIENPNGWVRVSFPAIQNKEPTALDPREEGEALWPERHSAEKLLAIKERTLPSLKVCTNRIRSLTKA